MDDLISRQAAIDIVMQYCPDDDGSCSKAGADIREMLDELEDMPSAQPERPKGEWMVSHIPDSMLWECNQCGFDCGAHSFNFCPNCGADMRGEQKMSNQEAIALLRNLEDSLDAYCELNEKGKTAFRMAIEALNCSEFPNSSDTIYRQAAIDALGYAQHRFTVADEAGGMGTVKWSEDVIYFAAAERILTELPSAQPEIIRCKDCKHKNVYRFPPKYDERDYCEKQGKVVDVADFCSWAERREE